MIDPPKTAERPTLESPYAQRAGVVEAAVLPQVETTEPSGEAASGEARRTDDPALRSSPSSVPGPPPEARPRVTRAECFNNDEVLEYALGQASAELLAQIDDHLDRCRACQELIDTVLRAQVSLSNPHPSQVTTFHKGSLLAGRYRVERFLGKGGMGEVYAAQDELTDKLVALKTVLCTATDDPRAIRKLFGEVVHAQRVAHPHVFKIYDLHEHLEPRQGRVPFFTMEFIAGESLGKRLRRAGALPLAEARSIARQLLAGLGAAHDKGVLHLDFKSDNVMLRQSGGEPDAVIMDFGLSRIADVEARQRTSEHSQAAGTMPYMAIEQLECRKDVGAPADVYAFGVVLYEMLTGTLPFRGASMGAILLQQVRERPVPPSRHRPELSRWVDAFVLECLRRDPAERHAHAGLALAALEAIPAWSEPPQRRARPGLWPLVAVALVAVGIGLWRARGPRPTSPLAQGAALTESAALTPHALAPPPPAAAATAAPAAAAPAATGPGPARNGTPLQASRSAPPLRRTPAPRPATPAPSSAAAPASPVPAAAPAAPPEATSSWHGPPPRAVPKPAPL